MSQMTIGIYGDAGDQYTQGVVGGVIQYCTDKGGFRVRDFRMRKMLQDLDNDPPPWRGQVDGIIVGMGLDQYNARQTADWVVSGGVPAILIGHDWFDPRVPAFHVDHAQIAACAVEHLRKCGCESYIFLGFGKSKGSAERGKAFVEAVAAFGGTAVNHPTPVQFLGAFEDLADIRKDEKLTALLRQHRRPIGVFALNDYFAAAVCDLCRELGLSVPEDVRILGSGDTPHSRLRDLQISTVRTPRELLGYEMMLGMQRLLRGEPPPGRPTVVGGAFVIPRVSTVGAPEPVGNIHEVRKYIEDHACVGVTVDQLVEIVGVSRRSFENWFREQVGRSPRDEINRVRLEKAKQLLSRSDLSMARIALMVGFQESAAFSRFFKNETGKSPREFRQRAGAGDEKQSSNERGQNLEFHI